MVFWHFIQFDFCKPISSYGFLVVGTYIKIHFSPSSDWCFRWHDSRELAELPRLFSKAKTLELLVWQQSSLLQSWSIMWKIFWECYLEIQKINIFLTEWIVSWSGGRTPRLQVLDAEGGRRERTVWCPWPGWSGPANGPQASSSIALPSTSTLPIGHIPSVRVDPPMKYNWQ